MYCYIERERERERGGVVGGEVFFRELKEDIISQKFKYKKQNDKGRFEIFRITIKK